MKPLCVIPARAGSKRLPRKNIAPLDGKPLLAWTIESAQASGIFDRVYVSTESEAIAEIARGFGADVSIRRPIELAGDEITNVAVSLHLYDMLAACGLSHDAIVCLQPSSPFRDGEDIAGAWRHFVNSSTDFMVSVTPIDPHNFHWALQRRPDGKYGMVFGERYLTVRQKLPEFFRPDGAIKIARVERLRVHGNFFGPSLEIYPLDETHAVSIATARDFVICEALVRWRKNALSDSTVALRS